MRDPSQFESALDISFMITVILNCSFGCMGYLFFGNSGGWISCIMDDGISCAMCMCAFRNISYPILFDI